MSLLRSAARDAFGLPRGWLGAAGGRLMARSNRSVNAWVVDLLEVGPRDRVLEVGCGPGVALEFAAARATEGTVVGLDPSPVMLRQAAERNAQALRRGVVELRQSSADEIPAAPQTFTRVFSSNSVQFWPSVPAALAEIHRVMAPGARFVIATRLRRETWLPFDPSRYGWSDEQIEALAGNLKDAGFTVDRVERRHDPRQDTAAVIAAVVSAAPA